MGADETGYAGHSGAQWEYEAEETSDGYAHSVYDERGQRLTEPYIVERAARLIAAAPEMLEALKDIASHDLIGLRDPYRCILQAIKDAATRAIAKAEGCQL